MEKLLPTEVAAQLAAGIAEAAPQLQADRADFLRWWLDVHGTGSGVLAGRVEVAVAGYRDPVSRPLWLDVGRGAPVHRHWAGLPAPDACAAVLISPISVTSPPYRERPRQWRTEHVSTHWPLLFLDIDKKDLDAAGEDVDALLDRMSPQPTVVVRSGSGGVHVYWALSEGVPVATALDLNRRLARLYHGDPAQTRGRPSLRLPGSVNVKWGLNPPELRLCTLDRARSNLDARVPVAAFADLPRLHTYKAPARAAATAREVPDWVPETIRRLGGGKCQVSVRRRNLLERAVVVPERCPKCESPGTAWCYSGEPEPRVGCHRPSCPGVPDLRAAALRRGVVIPTTDELDETRWRDVELEQLLKPPTGPLYSTAARAAAQDAMRQGLADAWLHNQRSGVQPHMWVLEAATGTGKDYTLLAEVERHADGPPDGRIDVYAKSQHHLKLKVLEHPNPDRAWRLHVSPQSLVAEDGDRCDNPAMPRATGKGWEPSRVCGTCPRADTCGVRKGYIDVGGTQEPRIDAYTTRRLQVIGPANPGRLVWADESFAPVVDSRVTAAELTAFLGSAAALAAYKPAARLLLAELARPWGFGVSERWGPGLWAAEWGELRPLPPVGRLQMPGTPETGPGWPKWIYGVLRACVGAATGNGAGTAVWFRDHGVEAWTLSSTVAGKATVHSNASWWAVADLFEVSEVTRIGTQLQPRHLTRLHYPHKRAVRGGYNGRTRILEHVEGPDGGYKRCNKSWLQPVREAVRLAKERWAVQGGVGEPRVLVATYKGVADNGFGGPDGRAAFCAAVGATAVDYYERLVGVNTYAGWGVLVCLGAPNPGDAGRDQAMWLIRQERYGAAVSPAFLDRMSEEVLCQTEGRLRALASELPQVVLCITPRAPTHWQGNGEILHPATQHGRASEGASAAVWELAAESFGCMSVQHARWLIRAAKAYRAAAADGSWVALGALEMWVAAGGMFAAFACFVLSNEVDFGAWEYHSLPEDWLDRYSSNAGLSERVAGPGGRYTYMSPEPVFGAADVLKLLKCLAVVFGPLSSEGEKGLLDYASEACLPMAANRIRDRVKRVRRTQTAASQCTSAECWVTWFGVCEVG